MGGRYATVVDNDVILKLSNEVFLHVINLNPIVNGGKNKPQGHGLS